MKLTQNLEMHPGLQGMDGDLDGSWCYVIMDRQVMSLARPRGVLGALWGFRL